MKIAILGTTGMLGSALLKYFSKTDHVIYSYSRDVEKAKRIIPTTNNVVFHRFDHFWLTQPNEFDYVINCVGIIKPLLKNENYTEIVTAVDVNVRLPHKLAGHCCSHGTKIIQIATDCVYAGVHGPYNEKSLHDPTDVYGKTKSLGEVKYNNFFNLRCSIIGKEFESKLSLLEWFLSQPDKSNLNGYTNHLWNGISCLQFAKICDNIINNNIQLPNLLHVVPKDSVSKYGLLNLFKKYYQRDLSISASGTATPVNRTLSTLYTDLNEKIWNNDILTIEEMIAEMVIFA